MLRLRRAASALLVGAIGAAVFASGADAFAADTPWGTSGAQYSGGVVCALPDGTRVAMARWDVGGATVYATSDIAERGGVGGPAPSSGVATPMSPGEAGLDGRTIAAAAYLISHHARTDADIAETSALIARASGGGATQARCLGQQGTSAQRATAAWARAQRYAGPYAVSVGRPTPTKPGAPVALTATVTSAAGVATPGLTVEFRAGESTASAPTDAAGVARVRLAVGSSSTAATAVVATVTEPTSLLLYDSTPASVSLAAPTTYQGVGSLVVVAHPRPVLTLGVDHSLTLVNQQVTPAATVTGSFGYSGTGSISLRGPVAAARGRACSSLTAASFAAAPQAWTGSFAFIGDGVRRAGTTSAPAAGCYALQGTLLVTNSDPTVRATAAYSAAATVTVSALTLSSSTGSGVAPLGPLTTTVTAANAGRAQVQSTVVEYGPLTGRDGGCAGLDWSHAPTAGASDPVSLTAASATVGAPPPSIAATNGSPASLGSAGASPGVVTPSTIGASTIGASTPNASATSLAASVKGPAVTRLGCYSLMTRNVVTLDGRSVSVDLPVGAQATTVSVLAPILAVRNASYGGRQGAPMTGAVALAGTYRYRGVVSISLASAPAPLAGCREAAFGARPKPIPGLKPTTVLTSGDGTYAFRTPVAPDNRCYAVTASFTLSANGDVRVAASAPTAASVFLAGVGVTHTAASDVPVAGGGTLAAALITLGIAAVFVVAVALLVIAGVAISRRRSPWATFRPELRLDANAADEIAGPPTAALATSGRPTAI